MLLCISILKNRTGIFLRHGSTGFLMNLMHFAFFDAYVFPQKVNQLTWLIISVKFQIHTNKNVEVSF